VKVTSSNGFDGKVSLSVTGLPPRATSTFKPASFFGRGTSTLSITTPSSTPLGTYRLTITATAGGLTHSANVSLTIQ
jgi:hypothetical protein